MPWIHLTARPEYNRTIPEPFKSSSYDIYVHIIMKSVILRGYLRIMKTVTQTHLQFSSSLMEGVEWGGGWERINSFSLLKRISSIKE